MYGKCCNRFFCRWYWGRTRSQVVFASAEANLKMKPLVSTDQDGVPSSRWQQAHRPEMQPSLLSKIQIPTPVDSAMMTNPGGGGRLAFDKNNNFPALAGQKSKDLAVPSRPQSFTLVQSSGYGLREPEGASMTGQPSKGLHQSQHGYGYILTHLNILLCQGHLTGWSFLSAVLSSLPASLYT